MKIRKYIIGATAGLLLVSCNKMDYNEYTAFDHSYIDRNFEYVGGFMTTIYNNLDTDWGNFSGAMLSSATDESEYSHDGNAIEDFYNGAWSPANPRMTIWNNAWAGITYCNEMLDNWQGLEFPEFNQISKYKAKLNQYNNYQYECRWARAYFYFTLVRQYGDVPFKIHNASGPEQAALPRTSTDEIFKFIDDECADIQDKIIEDYTNLGDLATDNVETGRANKFAVMALRAQAALYHASPLFNKNNDAELWHQAALRYKEYVTAAEAAGKTLANDYKILWSDQFYSNSEAAKEIIFARRTAAAHSFENYNFPVGYSSAQGGNCPTQDLVDAYNMKASGKMIDDATSGYDPTNPYAGRDPRFEMTIAHNEDAWPKDLANTSYTKLQTYVGGYHARPRVSYATPTSYYLKKFCFESQVLRTGRVTDSAHGWLTFRMGQAYLDYAEALFQWFKSQGNAAAYDATAPDLPTKAITLLNKTRRRTGVMLPTLTTTDITDNDTFWKRYKNERQVELAFEGHRFYDIRRWKEDGDKFMNIHRMEITVATYAADGVTPATYTYKVVPVTRGTGKWQDKWNLFPISQTEIMKSGGAMTQNPGW